MFRKPKKRREEKEEVREERDTSYVRKVSYKSKTSISNHQRRPLVPGRAPLPPPMLVRPDRLYARTLPHFREAVKGHLFSAASRTASYLGHSSSSMTATAGPSVGPQEPASLLISGRDRWYIMHRCC